MLCSISTGKSGSKWLDRLRSSKGFPTGTDLDLDQFLNLQNPDPSETNIEPKSKPISTEEPVQEKENREWFGVMSDVLSELFNMKGSNDFHRKKSSRKQPNPKSCVLSSSPNLGSENGGVSPNIESGDNSFVDTKQRSEENVGLVGVVEEEEEEERYSFDPSGFSRAEVTVIDTSYSSWKFEKLLFRRKNVWRVREKNNGKAMTVIGRKKKRKAEEDTLGEESGGGGGGDRGKKLKGCFSSKDGNGKEHLMLPSNYLLPLSDKMDKDKKETPDAAAKQVPKKRFKRKSKKCGSSVILIKNIPTSKKNGANISKSCLKLTQ